MSYQKENYIRIKEEFSKKYKKAQESALARRSELYEKIPEVWRLDGMLAKTGMEIMDAIMGGEDAMEALDKIRVKNERLLRERAELLRAHGYDPSYSDVRYECEKCGDSGFVDLKMCDCMKKELIKAGYESSGLGALIRTQSFDNFSLDYYGAKADNVAKAVGLLRRFAEGFDDDTYVNFLLIGGTGLGKTHLSTSVAKTVIDRGNDVLYVTALEMIRDFEDKRFGDGSGVRNDLWRYTDVQLLIIDDLGTEVNNQFTISCLYDVINHRINHRKSTFINTNLSYRELEARYSDRITSRLLGEYRPIVLEGTDIRKQKIRQGN